ncbi:hypothetical protein GCM10017620_26210 [Brevundimonas intermedia]|uniref:Uncharacterized protein n=1 Tax=Brevundimonas intermedia TaxID=74315 RepID=A0ABQ5TEL9_9CAUL|nr:hypothetical protein [Brevundimonas intermedia]GLK49648.1 hypothetical protein GCM10017620_26210 [Brevundimonas intermedia]
MTATPFLIRRYCSCDLERICRCDLPRTLSGWTVGKLSRLRLAMREHGSLSTAAAEVGETLHRANVALDTMLGKTPTQALAALEAKASRDKYQAEQQATLQALSSPVVQEALAALRLAS